MGLARVKGRIKKDKVELFFKKRSEEVSVQEPDTIIKVVPACILPSRGHGEGVDVDCRDRSAGGSRDERKDSRYAPHIEHLRPVQGQAENILPHRFAADREPRMKYLGRH